MSTSWIALKAIFTLAFAVEWGQIFYLQGCMLRSSSWFYGKIQSLKANVAEKVEEDSDNVTIFKNANFLSCRQLSRLDLVLSQKYNQDWAVPLIIYLRSAFKPRTEIHSSLGGWRNQNTTQTRKRKLHVFSAATALHLWTLSWRHPGLPSPTL